MRVSKRVIISALTLIIISNSLFSQEKQPTDTIEIDPVVVTATRTDNKLLNIPVRIHALTASSLSTMPLMSVDDALRYVPGVNISRPFGILSSKAIISMRGLSGKEQGRVLVLLDGIPLNKSDGGTVDWNMIDLADIEKIEVAKGAGSSVYGGSAMGGMINIVTRRPKKKIEIRGNIEYGTYNTLGGRLGVSGLLPLKNDNQFFWSVSSLYRKSDGYITQSESEKKENQYVIRSNMREAGINFRTGYVFNKKNVIEALVKYYDDRRGTGEKVFQPEGNVTDHDSYGLILNYRSSFSNFSLQSSAYILSEQYKKVNEYVKDDYTWYNVLSTRNDLGWLNSLSHKIGKHSFMTGIDIKSGSVDGQDVFLTSTDIVYNKGKIFNIALFLQDEIKLSKNWGILLGLRYDNSTFHEGSFYIKTPSGETAFMLDYQAPDMPSVNSNALSPRFSVQYKLDNYSDRLFITVSRGFRPSELEYLCRSGRVKGGFKIASPSLKPEFLTNLETGIDLTPFPKSRFSASAYFSHGKDFQYYVSNGQTINMGFGSRPIFIRDNLGSVNIYGLEADYHHIIHSGITLNCSYAYSHSEILNYTAVMPADTVNLNGKSFTDVPNHIAILGLKMVNNYLNGSLLVRYTGEMFVNDQNITDEIIGSDRYPDYTTIDLKLWKEIKGTYLISLNLQNITDVKIYDSKYSVGPGRIITASIDFKF